MKYVHRTTGKVVIVETKRAAGMCDKTMGCTMVVYRNEEPKQSSQYTHFVMESKEFHNKHIELSCTALKSVKTKKP
jgi:hypothetical protein